MNQKYSLESSYYAFSKMFERASFYGLRALIVLYMVGETMKMERAEAFQIYGLFIGSITLGQIIGALLGDLLIGNRKTIILGGIMQAIGAFCLSLPSTAGLYLGLFLVVLGNGFFTPNLISNFGKLYLNKPKLMDVGFTKLYFAINLGSFLGIILITYIGEQYGYNYGFIFSGILMLISLIFIFLIKGKSQKIIEINQFSMNKRIVIILLALGLYGLFFWFLGIGNIYGLDLSLIFSEMPSLGISDHFWEFYHYIFIVLISLIAIIVWTYFYNSSFVKLMIGFVFGAVSLGLLFFIPMEPTENHFSIFLVSLIFLAISETHIGPIIYSILTKYANPKYLAILISLVFLPTSLISLISTLFLNDLFEQPELSLKISVIGMILSAFGIFIFLKFNKKLFYKNS